MLYTTDQTPELKSVLQQRYSGDFGSVTQGIISLRGSSPRNRQHFITLEWIGLFITRH